MTHMTRAVNKPAVVRDGILHLRGAPTEQPIAVGSAAWYAWLETATGFSYEGSSGHFGARRERFQRGGWYGTAPAPSRAGRRRGRPGGRGGGGNGGGGTLGGALRGPPQQ